MKSPPMEQTHLKKPRAGTVTASKIAKLEEQEAKLRALEEMAERDVPLHEREQLAKQKTATLATISKIKSKIISIQMRQDNHLEGNVPLPLSQSPPPAQPAGVLTLLQESCW